MNLPATTDVRSGGQIASGLGRGVGTDDDLQRDDRLSLGRILAILRRRLKLCFGIAGLVFLAGIALTMLQQKMYVATSTVLLTAANHGLQERVTEKLDTRQTDGDSGIASEIAIIDSTELAMRVVAAEQLASNRRFDPETVPPAKSGAATAADQMTRQRTIAQALQSGLTVYRVGNSYAVAIAYRNKDPQVAAQIANAYAREYAISQTALKKESTNEAVTFLSAKVEELRAQATADFGAVQNYRISNGLLSTTGETLTEQDISVYNQQYAIAKADAAADQARLSTARAQLRRGSTGGDVGEALSSPVVSTLRTQRAGVAARMADLKARYGSRYPDVQSAEQELASVDRQIQDEIDRVISNLEAKTAVSEQRLGSLSGTLGAAKGTLAKNNGAMVALDDLQRRAAASQGLYESYLARYREISASSGTERPEARVLSDATIPQMPDSPNVVLNLLLAGLFGTLLGLIAAFAAELQFRGLTTAQDVEQRTGLPFLGLALDNGSVKPHAGTALETVVTMPSSLLTEALRGIYGIARLPVAGRGSVLAVCSALAGEGKTTLAAMLGQTGSNKGDRVVVIDCDIVKRGLSRVSKVTDGPGLLEVINGTAKLDDVLRFYDDGRLAILPISADAEAGVRLMQNEGLRDVLAELKGRFDLTILDCPPLLAIAESREIAALADGVIIAAEWRRTPDDAIRAAARLLPLGLSNYTGVVLSKVNLKKLNRFAFGEAAGYYSEYQKYMTPA